MQSTSATMMVSFGNWPASRRALFGIFDCAKRYASKGASSARPGIRLPGTEGNRRLRTNNVGGVQRVLSQINARKGPLGPRIRTADMEVLNPRPYTREENMWRDPRNLHAKWLVPSDPTRYKPNFAAVEPKALMKEFTRSPDERTRNVLGSDWEKAMRDARDAMRPKFYAGKSQEHYEAMEEAKAISKARQSRAKGYVQGDHDEEDD